MSDGDWFDDFMDYKLSTSTDSDNSSSEGGCIPYILGAVIVLLIIAKLFG